MRDGFQTKLLDISICVWGRRKDENINAQYTVYVFQIRNEAGTPTGVRH